MEVAGLAVGAVGLVALYGACVDLIEHIESFRDAPVEALSLLAEFEVNATIFRKWSEKAGLSINGLEHPHDRRLDDSEIAHAVTQILICIRGIFTESRVVRDTLGGKPSSTFSQRQASQREDMRDSAFGSTASHGHARKRDRLGWSFGGKQKFAAQVESFGALVAKLHLLIPDTVTPNDLQTERVAAASGSLAAIDLLNRVLDRFKDEERERLLAWLGPIPYSELYETCLEKRTPGTCEWIFKADAFSEWRSSDFPRDTAKVLWIHGPAGFGKSVLCASVIGRLRDGGIPTFHYFHHSGTTGQENSTGILKTWIAQMVSYDLALSELAYQYLQGTDRISRASIWGLLDLLLQAVSCVLVVDGLDEYENDSGLDTRRDFLITLKTHLVGTRSRVLIVSRDEVDIRSQLSPSAVGDDVNLSEHAITKSDVGDDTLSFCKSVANARLANKSQDIKDDVAHKLATKCDGMFLWIVMNQRNLRGGKNKRQLDRVIEDLPANLESIYQRNWREILERESSDRERAMNIIRWTMCALRPLRIVEITEALAAADDEDEIEDALPDVIDEEYINGEILGLCGSFVELRSTGEDSSLASRTIHLKHFSVREFLLHTDARLEVFGLASSHETSAIYQNNRLARACLRYLQNESVLKPPTNTFKQAFFDYAVSFWPEHIPPDHDQDVASSVEKLFALDSKSWEPWRARFEQLWRQKHANEDLDFPSPSRIYYLASFNLSAPIDSLIANSPRLLNEEGGPHGTPIKAACAAGHSSLVVRLVQMGAQIHTSIGRHGTLLGTASFRGDMTCCQLLLGHDVDVNKGDKHGLTPLYLASMNGHINIVQLLLDAGARIQPCDLGSRPPLCAASKNGHKDIVELLLRHGADVDVMEDEATPLYLAAGSGAGDVARLLLSHKPAPIVDSRCNSITPLMNACRNGSLETCELLLNHGADLEARNDKTLRPLHFAIYAGHTNLTLELLHRGAQVSTMGEGEYAPILSASLADKDDARMLEILVQHGADIEAKTSASFTALLACCMNGHANMAKYLLERGADIKTRFEQTGDHPLSAAAWSGHDDVVNLLLDHGADIQARNHDGFTALHDAVRSDQARTVGLLITRGADVEEIANWAPPRGPLQWAAREGYIDVARTLLDHGADINANTSEVWAPLACAAYNGHLDMVEMLVQHGAEVNVKVGWAPLESAVEGEKYEIAKYLLQHGAKTTWTDVPSPLRTAIVGGKIGMTKLLLNHTADVNDLLEANGDRPLIIAARHGHLEVMQLLLDRGARVCELGRSSTTALTQACGNGNLPAVRLLLEYGADFRLDDVGWTPFHHAVQGGYLEVIQFLENRDTSVRQRTADGWSPLPLAAFHGHADVVRYFLEHGVDSDDTLPNGLTTLSMAAAGGHLETIKTLLDYGADVRYLEHRRPSTSVEKSSFYDLTGNESPLIIASRRDDPRVVELLLSVGANSEPRDHFGCTAFDWALQGPPELSSKDLWGESCSPTPDTVQREHIVSSLTSWIRARDAGENIHFENLGRYLLKLGDHTNARIAFERGLDRRGDVIHHSGICFRCRTIITSTTRYACLSCASNDLCSECYEKFRKDEVFQRCSNHEFFPIVADESVWAKRLDEHYAQMLEDWWKKLLDKYHLESDETVSLRQARV